MSKELIEKYLGEAHIASSGELASAKSDKIKKLEDVLGVKIKSVKREGNQIIITTISKR